MASAAGCGWYYRTIGQFLQSTDEARVRVDSTIVAPKVADNEPVKTGQLAATIDDRDYVVALDRGRGRWRSVKIVLDRADPLAGEVRPSMSVVASIDTRPREAGDVAPSTGAPPPAGSLSRADRRRQRASRGRLGCNRRPTRSTRSRERCDWAAAVVGGIIGAAFLAVLSIGITRASLLDPAIQVRLRR
jgi:hypothetical protein